MFKFHIIQHVPGFILRDKNGYALARAIEAAIKYINDRTKDGVDTILNIDEMAEWRLDEMAWELNCLYDFNASIDVKREWIRNAIPMYRIWGTPQATLRYLAGYFEDAEVDESWLYDGDPYHFRVTVGGEWTPENEAWARKAINTAKNVRSVLDSLNPGCRSIIAIVAEGQVYARFRYPMTGEENWAGRWPIESTIGVVDESGRLAAEVNAINNTFPYPMTGTYPEINTLGISGENGIEAAEAEDIYAVISYKLCGRDEI